ncbi:MAG: hypothetical protein HYU30_04615 [Chloroflexi bacterium]|nr:hypothetical protein [Chloroflexota bacterium]
MNQETTFFSDDKAGVLITDQRVVLWGVTHLPRDISAAISHHARPNQGWVLALIGTGVLLMFLGASVTQLAGLGFILIGAGILLRLLSRARYVVRLTVRGEEMEVLSSRDMLYVDAVVGAVTRASKAAGGWRPPEMEEES